MISISIQELLHENIFSNYSFSSIYYYFEILKSSLLAYNSFKPNSLFNHFSKFFEEFVIEEFRRKHDADKSYKGHKAMMLEIETYVSDNIKFDSKHDYAHLVDTLKLLAENDV